MIGSIEKRIVAQHRSSEESKRLQTIPGIGVLGLLPFRFFAPLADPHYFPSFFFGRASSQRSIPG